MSERDKTIQDNNDWLKAKLKQLEEQYDSLDCSKNKTKIDILLQIESIRKMLYESITFLEINTNDISKDTVDNIKRHLNAICNTRIGGRESGK